MWTKVLAVLVPILAILSYVGDINDKKSELIRETQDAELQCRAARDQIKQKLRDLGEADQQTSEAQVLRNQMRRFTDNVGAHLGLRAYLLHRPTLYLTPSQVEFDRRDVLRRNCIS